MRRRRRSTYPTAPIVNCGIAAVPSTDDVDIYWLSLRLVMVLIQYTL